MKHLFSLVLCMLLCLVGAVAQTYEYTPDNGTYEFERAEEESLRIEEVFWEEDFSDGIPVGWTNTNYDTGLVLTDAKWEYRSSTTTPNNLIGTAGNCIDDGLEGGEPILSPTADNGFLIFDSDFWDSSEGDCGDFGSGISAAPHNSSLTTASLDLTDKVYVALEFNQYLKNFDSVTKIQLSVNGGEFQDVIVNDFTGTNASSPRDMRVRKNISGLAGGESDVKIRFSFSGSYYFWMIDDIQLISIEQNNVQIDHTLHGDLDIQSSDDFEDFLGMQYFKYPSSSTIELDLSAQAENRGGEAQMGVNLTTTITQGGSEIDSSVSGNVTLFPDESTTFETGIVALPSDVETYELEYVISQNQEDESPDNNEVVKTIEVTPSTLARDEGGADSYYFPAEEFDNTTYEVGAVYVPSDEGNELYSISAGMSSSTLTGSHCYATLYGFSLDEGVILEPIATTELQVVQFFHLNSFGDEQMMVFNFDTPISLIEDSTYLAVVGTIDTPSEVTFSMSGEAQPLTAWARFNDDDGVPSLNYLDRIPMVRMNFDVLVDVEETETNAVKASIYPNPASDVITLEYDLASNAELIIGLFDIQGKHLENLYVGNDQAGSHKLTIDVSSLPTGSYVIRMNSELGKLEKTLVIE